MRKRIQIFILIAVLGCSFLLSACNAGTDNANASTGLITESDSQNQTSGKYKVDIPALNGSLCSAAFWIAYEKGFFIQEGVEANMISSTNETSKTGLNNGTMAVSYGDFQYFQSMEQNVKASVVDAVNLGCIDIIARSDDDSINKAADLKGKKIAVNSIGGTPYQVLGLWISKEGLSVDASAGDVSVVAYSDGNLELQALKSGEVDAAAVWDPYGPKAQKSGEAKVLLDNAVNDDFAGRACCFLFASDKVLKEKPDEIAAVIRALHKAELWIGQNPDEAVQIIAEKKYAEIDDTELARQMLINYGYAELGTGKHDVKGDITYYAGWLQSIGLLKKDSGQFVSDYYQAVDLGE
ncbi:MAG TPA: ABC transporter substrate-binding protein [Lachnospiraceae bacterium]|nr:ABC transporter substrate-binding protein [Lachnospiraceae bacterium]